MRLIRFILVLGVCVLALGLYRGWFAVSKQSGDPASNKVDIKLTVDPDLARDDANRAAARAKEIGHQATNTTNSNGR